MRKPMNKGRKRILAIGIFLVVLFLCGAALICSKTLNLNQYLVFGYALRGVDVSHHQGEVDWKKLEGQGIDFAFVKATEGSSHIDEAFAVNWQAAGETKLYVGAYHFFSFDSAGKTQAEWYIQNVGDLEGKLAPVADVEYYADKSANPPEKAQVVSELRQFLQVLEEQYQIKPIIYTTYKVYKRYIEGEFEEYPLWIRNVYYPPDLDMRGKWQFWQYMDRAVLEGYTGPEKYMDLNVFQGDEEDIQGYVAGSEY